MTRGSFHSLVASVVLSLAFTGSAVADLTVDDYVNQAHVAVGTGGPVPPPVGGMTFDDHYFDSKSGPPPALPSIANVVTPAQATSVISATSSSISNVFLLKRNTWPISPPVPALENIAYSFSQVVFEVDVNSTYSLSGVTSPLSNDDTVHYQVWLSEVTGLGGPYVSDLFDQTHGGLTSSLTTPAGTSFTLSGPGLTGTLLAGKLYEFAVVGISWGGPSDPIPILAFQGNTTLNVAAVPEPAAYLFGGIVCGVVGLGMAWRRWIAQAFARDAD